MSLSDRFNFFFMGWRWKRTAEVAKPRAPTLRRRTARLVPVVQQSVICCGPTEVKAPSFSFVTWRTWFSIGPLSNPLSLRTTNSFVAGLYFSCITLVIDWHYSLTANSHPNFICKFLESWCKSSHLTQTISVNGCALSTQQSTCWACSSDHISSDGNLFISLNNLSLLMNLYNITPPVVKALCIYWVKRLLIEVLLSGYPILTEGSRHWCWLSLLFPFLAS